MDNIRLVVDINGYVSSPDATEEEVAQSVADMVRTKLSEALPIDRERLQVRPLL